MVARRSSAHRAPERPTMEHHHRDIRGGTARAAVFGVSDGLVSNVSLVLGVAAGSHYAQGPVRLAGLAGLIAGAVSMAIGEYVSMTQGLNIGEATPVLLSSSPNGGMQGTTFNVQVLGLVENMSYFLSPSDGKRYDIFGSGGGEREAKRLRVPLLGQIPIDIATREGGDRGMPIVGEDRQSPVAAEFRRIAENLRKTLPY